MAMIQFLKVDTDMKENRALTKRYKIMGIPTLLFMKNGEVVHKASGFMEREKLNAHIAKMLYGVEVTE